MESKRSLNLIAIVFCVLLTAFINLIKAEESFKTQHLFMPNVQPKVPNTYLCTAFEMPKHDFQYIVKFTPKSSVQFASIHHLLIYGCENPGQQKDDASHFVWDCGQMNSGQQSGYIQAPTCSNGTQILYPFSKDTPSLKLPEGIAFKVGKDTGINYLVLQIHYGHVGRFLNGETDHSGAIISFLPSTTNQVKKIAGMYLLRTDGRIRPHEEEHFEVACLIKEPVILHPFAFLTHTHALGRVVAGYKIDKKGKWHLIGKRNPQRLPMVYPIKDKDLTVEYGDVLAARCTMYNYRNKTTYVGRAHEDEMCNFYMLYYVEGDKLLMEKNCSSSGPDTYYWDNDLIVGKVPQKIDKEASQLEENI